MVHFKQDKQLGRTKASLEKKDDSRLGCWKAKFVQFCKRTDLHGFKYIVMEELNVVERSCWAVAVVVSIIFAAYFVVTAYRWYARNPIVTVIESTQGAIWDVPFPAVTICDLNVVSRRAARALADTVTLPANVTADNVFETLRWVPLLHSSTLADADQKRDLRILQDILDLNNISIESLLKQLSPASSCSNLVQRCMWKNTIYRCEQLFEQIFTLISLCCTFNYYGVDALENDKTELLRMEYPRRVASCGYQTALTVLLNTDPDDYYSSTVASQGSLVFVDNAYNIPDLDSPVRLVNPATEVLIALSPEGTYTTSGIKSFRPDQRQCYYSNEIQLGNFRRYSFHNCMAYQKIEIIRQMCDCVPFFFPMKEYHRTCNFHDVDCLDKVTSVFALRMYTEGLLSSNLTDYVDKLDNVFQCLPECEHYDYPLEVALGKLARNVPLDGLPFFDHIDLENRSVLNVFYNDLVSTRYRRDVYLNWQNILAAFGGLLSLMLGFTLISGFDFLLFFTFRLAYDTFTRKPKVKPKSNYAVNVEKVRTGNWMKEPEKNRFSTIRSKMLEEFGHRKY
ncbi:sodium channel protein Nach-like [Epargyreus clarus]|uniref:sodium channel protein Nach-like n=1 Tax=Epargyreus clarus TaxID=520877 RepID=UPI003C2CD51E